MSAQDPPPPPPPPHGQNPRPPGAMPDGNYDIFIIPPHSAGSGFLYLPSLGTQRNSFLAGVACTLLAVGVYTLVMPVLRDWMSTVMAGGGVGFLLLIGGVGVAGWAWGKTQEEANRREGGAGAGSASAGAGSQQQHAPPPPRHEAPPPPKPDPKPPPKPSAASGWEKAREETRKREEARKREEELKKVREEMQRKKEEAEKAAKAKAEKDKWEQVRAREKERREREARERIQREREAKQNADKNKAGSAPAGSTRPSPQKQPSGTYVRPTAKSYAGTEESYSYRPYDKAHTHKSSASSISGLSESSYAPSATTARTTPPPSQRGPYSTKDPDKIQIKAVYLFSDSFPTKPTASLISNQGSVTDGLVLRIKTEGLFIDDDVRGVPQREWDVKAWTLKLIEDGVARGVGPGGGSGLHVLRATTRDAENKRYTFVLEETEAWKVAVGLARLRKGSQLKPLGMAVNGMKENEVKGLLSNLGWI